MKRSLSESMSPPPSSPPASMPSTPRKKTKTASTKSSPVKSEKGSPSSSGWTPEKKSRVVEIIVTAGLANTKLEDIAAEVGLTKQQLRDATQRGKNNLRQKVIDAAAGFAGTGSSR